MHEFVQAIMVLKCSGNLSVYCSLASSYVSEICVPEALAGIMSSTLHIPYEQADALLRETEDKSLIQAMRKGLEKSKLN